MSTDDIKLVLRSGPFLKRGVSTPRLMLDVVIALIPTVIAATYFFGVTAILLLLATGLGAVCTEALFGKQRLTLFDASAFLTGIILALTLPPTLPLWMAFLGGAIAIGLGKTVWGGLGDNLFNPALVGRAFLQAAFPTALTTWRAPGDLSQFLAVNPATLAYPMMQPGVDVVTTASPLAQMKFAGELTAVAELFWGNIAGSLGETSALAILLGGIYMASRRTFDWRIPASILLATALFSGALHLFDSSQYPPPLFMLCSGGLLFGAIYMATDPVTSPIAPRGAWIFGAGIALLVVLIRLFGGLPEGVMYAILLMNAATPLIERVSQPRPFGRKRAA